MGTFGLEVVATGVGTFGFEGPATVEGGCTRAATGGGGRVAAGLGAVPEAEAGTGAGAVAGGTGAVVGWLTTDEEADGDAAFAMCALLSWSHNLANMLGFFSLNSRIFLNMASISDSRSLPGGGAPG